MDMLYKKLWQLVELAKNDEIGELEKGYLEKIFENDFKKILNVSSLEDFSSNFKINDEKKIDIYENLYKIFLLHKDTKNAKKFKELKIEKMIEDEKENIEYEYFDLAMLEYEEKNFLKSLKNVKKVLENIDIRHLTYSSLELYMEALIMQNQLKQDLLYDSEEILKEIEYLQTLYMETMQYLTKQKQAWFRAQILYLNLLYYLSREEYSQAIEAGRKILKIFEETPSGIKLSLKYRVYEELGYAYLLNKEYKNALNMAKKAIDLKNSLLNIDIFSSLLIAAESYLGLGEYEEALNYTYLADGHVNNSIKKLEYIYELLARIYKAMDDQENAKEYLEKWCNIQKLNKSNIF